MRLPGGLCVFIALTVSLAQANGPPQRIISLNLVSDIVLLDLVESERIAALSHVAVHPHLSIVHERAAGFRTVRTDAEEVMALRPDLVIGARWGQGAVLDLLGRLGVGTHEINLADSYAGIRRMVLDLAEALGEPARGQELLARMDAERAHLQTLSRFTAPSPAATLGASGFTGGDNLLAREQFEDAALVAALPGRMDLEALVLAHPAVLVNVAYHTDRPSLVQLLLQHPALRQLRPEIRTVPLRELLNATHRSPEASASMRRSGNTP